MTRAREWQQASRQDRAEECVRQGKLMHYMHGSDLLIVPDSAIKGFIGFAVTPDLEIKEHLGAVGPELRDTRDVNYVGNRLVEAGLPVRMDVEV